MEVFLGVSIYIVPRTSQIQEEQGKATAVLLEKWSRKLHKKHLQELKEAGEEVVVVGKEEEEEEKEVHGKPI